MQIGRHIIPKEIYALVRKAKLDYYNKLNHKMVSGNKTFWKNVKPFFKDKGVNHCRTLLVEKNRTFQIMMKYLKN